MCKWSMNKISVFILKTMLLAIRIKLDDWSAENTKIYFSTSVLEENKTKFARMLSTSHNLTCKHLLVLENTYYSITLSQSSELPISLNNNFSCGFLFVVVIKFKVNLLSLPSQIENLLWKRQTSGKLTVNNNNSFKRNWDVK